MKTYRELLELAAKAAGVCLHPANRLHHSHGKWCHYTTCMVCNKDPSNATFSPITDDGDNRRLQVALKLGLVPVDDGGWACITWDHDDEVTLAFDLDPNLAIVKAAAIIGGNMK